MPRIVYGVLDIHRSHRVEVPDVARDVEGGRPDACTACHADRDAAWAADRMRDFWGARFRRPAARPDGVALEMPGGARVAARGRSGAAGRLRGRARAVPTAASPAGARGFALPTRWWGWATPTGRCAFSRAVRRCRSTGR